MAVVNLNRRSTIENGSIITRSRANFAPEKAVLRLVKLPVSAVDKAANQGQTAIRAATQLYNGCMLCTFLSFVQFVIGFAFPHLAQSQEIGACPSTSTSSNLNMSGNRERTFIMLKPDAVHRGLIGEIVKRFEQKGFKLVAMKMMHVSFD